MASHNHPNGRLIQLTIRINLETYNTVSALAKEYGVKKADIIRLAIDNSLEYHLARIRYIDAEQAKVIHRNIVALGNILVDIRDQLRRIGINYNREVKLRNVRRKKADAEERKKLAVKNQTNGLLMQIINEETTLDSEIEDIMKDVKLLDKDELDSLIQRMEKAINKAGDNLCMF